MRLISFRRRKDEAVTQEAGQDFGTVTTVRSIEVKSGPIAGLHTALGNAGSIRVLAAWLDLQRIPDEAQVEGDYLAGGVRATWEVSVETHPRQMRQPVGEAMAEWRPPVDGDEEPRGD